MDRRNFLNSLMDELYHTVGQLYDSSDIETKNNLVRRLEVQLCLLSQFLDHVLRESGWEDSAAVAVQQDSKGFTRSDLSKYDGTEGSPAYVAVNGIVYDVTGHPVWAAATHFGLKAGADYTAAFASCHASGDALMKLTPVGRLQDEQLL